MRRERRLTEMQKALCKWILPINILALCVLTYCAMTTFSVDRTTAIEKSKSIFYAGIFLQSYWIYIVLRDLMITINFFARGQGLGTDVVLAVLVVHFFSACIDLLVLSGLSIWSSVAINSDEAKLFVDAPSETGMPSFVKIMSLNATMGIVYVLAHLFAPCIVACVMVRY